MFIAQHKVRMHDTDTAGVIFFSSIFRFAHDAWEDLMEKEGLYFKTLFSHNAFAFVIVHAEANYKAPLHAGDALEVHVNIEKIGNTSFTVAYKIYKKPDQILAGTAKTIHVTLDRKTRQKIPVPNDLRATLEKYT